MRSSKSVSRKGSGETFIAAREGRQSKSSVESCDERVHPDDSLTSPELGPGWDWGATILGSLEQSPLYHAVNFSLPMITPGSRTVRATSLAIYLCPSADHFGPIVLFDPEGKRLVADLAPSRYVASAGQFREGDSPADNNGLFFRNSWC